MIFLRKGTWSFLLTALALAQVPADRAVPRTDRSSLAAHAQLLEKKSKGRIDLYFEGDSITRRWGATDYPELLAHFKKSFFGWNAADFGWGGDTTWNILWRLNDGELDGVHPKVIVLQAGTNNLAAGVASGEEEALAIDITRGIEAILGVLREKAPEATIILTAIFPRNDNMAAVPVIEKVNANLSELADVGKIRYLNINDSLADREGRLFDGMMNPDKLHPTLKTYQIWADALKPILTELLGAPSNEDHAPPPTGNPGL